jgi:MFS family permease
MTLMVLFFVGGSVSGCSWNSWLKDIVPQKTMGTYLAKRLSAATALGAVLTIVAGFGIDGLTSHLGEPSKAYAVIFLAAALIGLVGAKLLAEVPEPKMPDRKAGENWIASLIQPTKDTNFRRLLAFSFSWSFTVIISSAFFAVYMLNRIGISMSTVILLAVLSQVTNIYFFKVWGALADRFSNKSVLRVSVPLFILLILLYPFTTLPERHSLTIPILILIHVLGGIATAGFNLCAANIALRLAPHGKATAYLGANAFCSGLAATIAPIVGGIIGSFFAAREISLRFFYNANIEFPDAVVSIPAMNFRGLDFVFFIAALSGLYALHRLSLVDEEGTVSEAEVRDQVFASMRQSLINSSSFATGMRRMTAFPYELVRNTRRSTTSAILRATKGAGARSKGAHPREDDGPS